MTSHANFWRSFLAIRPAVEVQLTSGTLSESTIARLTTSLAAVDPGLRWEVGPGVHQPYGLTISPGGVRRLLPTAVALAEAAPHIPSWEVHVCRRAKRFHVPITIDSAGGSISIDPRRWRYTLVSFNSGEFFDVTLWTLGDSEPWPIDLRKQAAYVVLDSLLGERRVIESIGDVHVQDGAPHGPSGSIDSLQAHLRSLGRKSNE